MASYTCITCRVMFAGKEDGSDGGAAELQKAHYKTDWHRYNLKRKVAELPPVTAENFQERVAAQKDQLPDQDVDTSCHCQSCNKHFSSANAYNNHMKSKKHRETAALAAEKTLSNDVRQMNAKNREMTASAAVATETVQKQCSNKDKAGDVEMKKVKAAGSGNAAAGGKKSRTVAGAVGGVLAANKESEEMDSDDDGSEESWSGDTLGLEECLFCPRVSESLEKNVKHMTTDHGFFIPDIEYLIDLEGLITHLGEKVGELHMCLWCGEKSRAFTELKGVQQHMVDKGHCKLPVDGDAMLEYADFYDYRKSYPDHKDGADGGEEEMDEGELPAGSQSSDMDETGFQLVLPSGATVGHRTLLKYYRQKLRPDRQLVLSKNSSAVSKVISHYKALGWTGTTGAAAETKAKDIAYVRRLQAQQWTRLGVKANKLQHHYRDQVFGF